MTVSEMISALEKIRDQHGDAVPLETPTGELVDSVSVSALDGHLAVVIWV